MTHYPRPETEAINAITLLPCPACGRADDAAIRPDSRVDGIVFKCLSCGVMVITDRSPTVTTSGYRDGLLAWNAWARKATKIKERHN